MEHEDVAFRPVVRPWLGLGAALLSLAVCVATAVAYIKGAPDPPQGWQRGFLFAGGYRLDVMFGSSPRVFNATPWMSRTDFQTRAVRVRAVEHTNVYDPAAVGGRFLNAGTADLQHRVRDDLRLVPRGRAEALVGTTLVYPARLPGRLALGDARLGMMPTISVLIAAVGGLVLELHAFRRWLRLRRFRSGFCASCRFPLDRFVCAECGVYYFVAGVHAQAELAESNNARPTEPA